MVGDGSAGIVRSAEDAAQSPALTVEAVLMRVHVQRVDRQVICRQVQRLEYLPQLEVYAVSVNNDLLQEGQALADRPSSCEKAEATRLRATLHLALYETQQMLLIHACRVVNVSVDLRRE